MPRSSLHGCIYGVFDTTAMAALSQYPQDSIRNRHWLSHVHWRWVYTAPPEDCGVALGYMELLNHYTKLRLEDILLESCKQYQIDKDKEAFMETLENLKWWYNREYFNRRGINHRWKQYASGDPEWEDNFM